MFIEFARFCNDCRLINFLGNLFCDFFIERNFFRWNWFGFRSRKFSVIDILNGWNWFRNRFLNWFWSWFLNWFNFRGSFQDRFWETLVVSRFGSFSVSWFGSLFRNFFWIRCENWNRGDWWNRRLLSFFSRLFIVRFLLAKDSTDTAFRWNFIRSNSTDNLIVIDAELTHDFIGIETKEICIVSNESTRINLARKCPKILAFNCVYVRWADTCLALNIFQGQAFLLAFVFQQFANHDTRLLK